MFIACGFVLQQAINISPTSFWENSYTDLAQRVTSLENQTSPVKWQVDTAGVFTFCGADYLLSDWFFRERLQDEIWRLYDRRGWLFVQYQRLGRYRPLIETELAFQDLPRDLIYLDERKDPKKSIKASCQYLRQLYDYFGDWLLAMASYNHGRQGIKSKMDQQKASHYIDLFLPTETYKYVFQIMAVRYVVEMGIMGDMSWLVPHKPLPQSNCETTSIKHTISLFSLSQQLQVESSFTSQA